MVIKVGAFSCVSYIRINMLDIIKKARKIPLFLCVFFVVFLYLSLNNILTLKTK